MSKNKSAFSATISRFSGFAELYDHYRPAPPALLGDILTRLASTALPELVIDLGSGTGLSTRYWVGKARQAIGIEPSADMRQQAERVEQAQPTHITRYQDGFSHQTGLPDGCADIVVCAQALHWMEPQSTFREAKRILRQGGVFAACDYDWPPTTSAWEADQAYEACIAKAQALEKEKGSADQVQRWEKSGHLARMRSSGCFRYVKEISIHHEDLGNAERLVGLALSQGMVMDLLKLGLTEAEIGLDVLRAVAERALGSAPHPWLWTSRVRFGIR